MHILACYGVPLRFGKCGTGAGIGRKSVPSHSTSVIGGKEKRLLSVLELTFVASESLDSDGYGRQDR